MSSSLQGFVMKRIWIYEDHKSKMKVWESPFIPSHLTFKSFEFHSISVNQSNNQSNLSIYYNIPKFRILGCYMKSRRKSSQVITRPPLESLYCWYHSAAWSLSWKKRTWQSPQAWHCYIQNACWCPRANHRRLRPRHSSWKTSADLRETGWG